MLVEVILPKAHAGIEGEDPDVNQDRAKDAASNKGKRVDVLADYSETRGGSFCIVISQYAWSSLIARFWQQNSATLILCHRLVFGSFNASTTKTRSTGRDTCLKTPT